MVTLKISRKLERALRLDDYLQKNQRNINNFHLNTHQAFRVPLKKNQQMHQHAQQQQHFHQHNNSNASDKEDELDSIKNNTSNFISENSDSINMNENQKSLHYRKHFTFIWFKN